jgi:hypothetical protein
MVLLIINITLLKLHTTFVPAMWHGAVVAAFFKLVNRLIQVHVECYFLVVDIKLSCTECGCLINILKLLKPYY